jgi:signal transduction histidine kinase
VTGDTEVMLRVETWAFWALRAAGLAIVGVVAFVSPPTIHDRLVSQAVAYGVMCAVFVVWAAAELYRARRPVDGVTRFALPGALIAMVTASAVGATAGGAGYVLLAFAVIATLSAGESTPLGTALAVCATGVLAIEVGGIVFDEDIAALLGYPLLIVVGMLTGRNRAAYRIQAEQAALLLAQHERLRAEQRRADVLDERTRIAREIHDVLAHSLGALGIQIQSARALLTDRGDVERALESLATAQRMASDGLTETRRAVHALRSDTLPLHEEIARAAMQHAERHKVTVHCETAGTPLPVPPDATIALLRTAQEALVNAAKHAPGQDVEIRLNYGDEGVRLTVSNELQTEQTEQHMNTVDGGYGLTGMRERLRLLRGTLDAGPDTQHWIVTADLPL